MQIGKNIILIIAIILIYSTNTFAYRNSYYLHKTSQFELLSSNKNSKIVMLGDSITERGLWSELTNRCDIINRGISGDTTLGLLNRLDSLNSSLTTAFIMIGANDILKDRDVRYIFKNYKKILEILKEKKLNIYIESTLFVGKGAPSIYNKKIKQLNSLLINYAHQNKIGYIDLNKKLSPTGYLNSKYSLDGLHLNANGYFIWLKLIRKYL